MLDVRSGFKLLFLIAYSLEAFDFSTTMDCIFFYHTKYYTSILYGKEDPGIRGGYAIYISTDSPHLKLSESRMTTCRLWLQLPTVVTVTF